MLGVVQPDLRLNAIILEAATRHEIEPALVKAIIMVESSFNPEAVSSRGAMGLMQLMPATAEALGVVEALDPVHNVDGGVRYLKYLLKFFQGDLCLALAAYNAGISRVIAHQGVPPFKATEVYVDKVLRYYDYYRSARLPQGRAAMWRG